MSGMNRPLRCSAALWMLVTLALAGCWPQTKPPITTPASPVSEKDDLAERRRRSGYVGIDQCVECHRERVNEFRGTRHFLACMEAAKVPMPAGFEAGKNRYASLYPELQFEMNRKGDEYWLTAIQQTPQGEQRKSARIDLVYGHGAVTDETYFSWQGKNVFEMPLAWLHPQQCWGATPINRHTVGDHSRPLTAQCLSCHSTWIDREPGTPEIFHRETALLGVTCERCHGPGHDHVAHHRQHPLEKTAQAIVHPGKLSRERLIDLCAQCHDNAIRFRKPAFSYQPGDVLNDFVMIPQYELSEDNHVANQVGGMRASRCFQKSETLTCVTCHDPHHPRTPSNAGTAACTACHKPPDCHEHDRLPMAIRDHCIDCHMPAVNKVQVNFRTEQDGYVPPVKRWEHRTAVYPDARDATVLAWLRTQTDDASTKQAGALARKLGTTLRMLGEKYRGEHRMLMAIDAYREAQRVDPNDETAGLIRELIAFQTELDAQWFRASQLIHENQHAEAITLLEDLLVKNPRMARAHGRLGTLYTARGEKERGIQHLRTANQLDPNDSYGHSMLGWLAYLDGAFPEALKHFNKANDLEPMNAKLLYQRGLVFVGMGRHTDAEAAFREVLEVSPDHLDASVALSRLYLEARRSSDAIGSAERANQIAAEKNPDVLLLLSDAFLQAGQFEDSRRAAEQALDVAKETNPELARRARSRLETLKDRQRSSRK